MKNGLLIAMTIGALLLGLTSQAQEESETESPREAAGPPEALRNPSLTLYEFRAEITRAGQLRQKIIADWARLDESDDVLYMRDIQVDFFNQGQHNGSASSGQGTIWLSDQTASGHLRHDILLTDRVYYEIPGGWILQAPSMSYANLTSTLRGVEGYIKQLKLENGYLVGAGDRFEMKISLQEGTFDSWKEYGNPTILKKTEEPEIVL